MSASPTPRKRGRPADHITLTDAEMLDLRRRGWTSAEIARRANCSDPCVAAWIERALAFEWAISPYNPVNVTPKLPVGVACGQSVADELRALLRERRLIR